MANRLVDQTSAYLRQHAENPVDWWPWGDEAFELARSTDRPILLSVGYSSCHWCHVMAHESFEDPEVAARMNRHFINITYRDHPTHRRVIDEMIVPHLRTRSAVQFQHDVPT